MWTHPFPEQYRALVYSKWLRSLRYGNDFFKLVQPSAYWEAYTRYLDVIFAKPRTILRLAVLTGDRDVVLGFAVIRDSILDYAHVHKDLRRQGIARALVPEHIDTITHLTRIGLAIWGNKGKKWKFNPFA